MQIDQDFESPIPQQKPPNTKLRVSYPVTRGFQAHLKLAQLLRKCGGLPVNFGAKLHLNVAIVSVPNAKLEAFKQGCEDLKFTLEELD